MSLIIVPIPLSKKKQYKRGYNQCTYIAKSLIKSLPPDLQSKVILIDNLLIKERETKQHSLLNKGEKLEEKKNPFALRLNSISMPQKKSLLNILLIDDVVTTGNTLFHASSTLKDLEKMGYEVRVHAFTIFDSEQRVKDLYKNGLPSQSEGRPSQTIDYSKSLMQ